VGARFYVPVQTGPEAHPAYFKIGTRYFPGVKSGWGVTLTSHPLLVPWSRRGRAVYLYSPCGPYDLYRASVPVQGCSQSASYYICAISSKREKPGMVWCRRPKLMYGCRVKKKKKYVNIDSGFGSVRGSLFPLTFWHRSFTFKF
jgi:hypothetical protein